MQQDAFGLIDRTAEGAWLKRAWWMNEDPPATLTLLSNGEWYYTEHGQTDVLAPGEIVVASVAATPLVLSAPEAIRDALLAAHAAAQERAAA